MTLDERERLRIAARIQFEEFWRSVSRWLLRLGVLMGLLYLLTRSHSIVTTLIGAGILASAAGALALPLSKLKLLRSMKPHGRRALCSGLALLVLVGMLVGIVFAFLKPFQDQASDLTRNWKTYEPQLLQRFDDFKNWHKTLPAWVFNLEPEQVRNLLDDKPDQAPTGTETHTGGVPAGVTDAVTGAFKNIGKGLNSLVELILLPVLAFYFLVDGKSLRNEFVRFVRGRQQQRTALAILKESGEIMRAYLLGQLILAVIAGVVIGALLGIFQIKYALILALVAAVTRVIPVIGPLLGGIPLGVLVFVQCAQDGRYGIVAVILIVFTVMHLVESKVITPMILGHRLHLHPVVIIVALLLGGEFFGLLGMFLAAPITALLRTVLFHLYIYPHRHPSHGTPRLRRALSAPKPKKD
jgi:predicted PurR-regulated permease PerM